MTEVLNEYFSSVFTTEDISSLPVPCTKFEGNKLSLEEGIVPSEWKEANITPLFKKGSRNKPENYRPVSLTSVNYSKHQLETTWWNSL